MCTSPERGPITVRGLSRCTIAGQGMALYLFVFNDLLSGIRLAKRCAERHSSASESQPTGKEITC